MSTDIKYTNLMRSLLHTGEIKPSRPGINTISKLGMLERYDITNGKIPVITTKKIFLKSNIHELIWMISGSTDIAYLKENNVSIWDSWVDPKTARYDNLSYDELYAAISKKYNVKEIIFIPSPVPELGVDGIEFTNHNEHNIRISLQIPDVLTILSPEQFLLRMEREGISLIHQFAELENIPTRKLVGGSIGAGAYGSMWRNIEDTVIINSSEVDSINSYLDKGFELVMGNAGKLVFSRKIDQLQNAIDLLKTNPTSRRIIVHAFDNRKVDFCELPPCHSFYQFHAVPLTQVERSSLVLAGTSFSMEELDKRNVPKYRLSCIFYMRSNDLPVGHPFNITQYALLTHMVAHLTNMVTGTLVWVGADTHIYEDQIPLVREQIARTPYLNVKPTVRFNPDKEYKNINDFKFEDIVIEGYDEYHPRIDYPVAV